MKVTGSSFTLLLSLLLVTLGATSAATVRSGRSTTSSSTSTTHRNDKTPHRALIDFMDQVTEEKEEVEIDILEEDGDADGVELVDNDQGEAIEDAAMEQQEEALEDEEAAAGMNEEEIELLRRTFVSYTPSPFESEWVDRIDSILESRTLCHSMLGTPEENDKIRKYMEMNCRNYVVTEDCLSYFCYYTDGIHYMFWNKYNYDEIELWTDQIPPVLKAEKDQDAGSDEDFLRPVHEPLELFDDKWIDIASKFVYYDEYAKEEYTEYIEPLISHLRFPLAGCVKDQPFLPDIAIHIQPPKWLERVGGRKILYDVGSPDWSHMKYVVDEWALHGIIFDFIISFASDGVSEEDDLFPKTVPEDHAGQVFRNYFKLVSSPEEEEGKSQEEAFFLPTKIMNQTAHDDYVIVKLDQGSANLKDAIVQFMIDQEDMALHVDEVLYQVFTQDNYMLPDSYFDHKIGPNGMSTLTTTEVYGKLQALREKGIRAHSWV